MAPASRIKKGKTDNCAQVRLADVYRRRRCGARRRAYSGRSRTSPRARGRSSPHADGPVGGALGFRMHQPVCAHVPDFVRKKKKFKP